VRHGSRLGAAATAIAVGLLVLAPGAAAWPGGAAGSPLPRLLAAEADHQAEPTPRPFLQPTVSLGKHNGYEVEVIGSGDRVYLSVDRGRGVSIYAAPGIVTSRRLEASFGGFGRVSLRFRVSANRSWVRPRRTCRGKQRFVNRLGVFTGTAAFRGEKGYVSARTHRARGYVTAIAAKCQRELREFDEIPLAATAGSSRSGPLPAFLTARRQEAGSVAYLAAEAFRRGTSFFAESSESHGGLAIIRYAFADGGSGRFEVDDTLASATVRPPAPFHGSAAYSAAADGSRTWRGSLSVNFPGAPRTPLVGPRFGVQLSAGY